ncbi:hypothetical protein GCAAIG_07160 [Candidatus Electronema halotolerans]|jgi:hypothetical protein
METYLVMVDVTIDESLKQNVFAFKVPTIQPLPLPGDLIQIPEAVAKQEGVPFVLKVLSRRFILDDLILDRLSRDCKTCIILLTEPPS